MSKGHFWAQHGLSMVQPFEAGSATESPGCKFTLPSTLGKSDIDSSLIQEKVKLLVTQSCSTLCDPLDYSWPGSSVLGILQARILE